MVNSHPGLTLAHLLLLLGTAAQFCDNELDVLMGDMEVSGNGVPNGCMVYFMENPIYKRMIWGYHHYENPYMFFRF